MGTDVECTAEVNCDDDGNDDASSYIHVRIQIVNVYIYYIYMQIDDNEGT